MQNSRFYFTTLLETHVQQSGASDTAQQFFLKTFIDPKSFSFNHSNVHLQWFHYQPSSICKQTHGLKETERAGNEVSFIYETERLLCVTCN